VWFREAVRRRHSIEPDALARSSRGIRIERVDDARTLKDAAMEMTLYHLAGSTHGDGILAVYFPRERLYAEADVWNPGAQLQPHVVPYATMDPDPSEDNDEIGIFASIYFFAVMLLVLICSNIALLLFARAATRESELAVRTALGASRGRIVAQLFAEALVLGGVAAVVGLVRAATMRPRERA